MCAVVLAGLDVVQLLLRAGANVNVIDNYGYSMLMRAIEMDSCTSRAQLLLDHAADIYATDFEGRNLLCAAACYGRVHMMEILVQRGLDINVVDRAGHTLLMLAAVHGQKGAAEWLLQQGLAVNAVRHDGHTALSCVSGLKCSNDAAVIELLLANGADVHKCAENGFTALDEAVLYGNVDCAKLLIAAGADVRDTDSTGCSVLHTAIIKQHGMIVQLLLQFGATAVMNTVVPVKCTNAARCCTSVTALMMCTQWTHLNHY
jgi:ankyrin repeat protein